MKKKLIIKTIYLDIIKWLFLIPEKKVIPNLLFYSLLAFLLLIPLFCINLFVRTVMLFIKIYNKIDLQIKINVKNNLLHNRENTVKDFLQRLIYGSNKYNEIHRSLSYNPELTYTATEIRGKYYNQLKLINIQKEETENELNNIFSRNKNLIKVVFYSIILVVLYINYKLLFLISYKIWFYTLLIFIIMLATLLIIALVKKSNMNIYKNKHIRYIVDKYKLSKQIFESFINSLK